MNGTTDCSPRVTTSTRKRSRRISNAVRRYPIIRPSLSPARLSHWRMSRCSTALLVFIERIVDAQKSSFCPVSTTSGRLERQHIPAGHGDEFFLPSRMIGPPRFSPRAPSSPPANPFGANTRRSDNASSDILKNSSLRTMPSPPCPSPESRRMVPQEDGYCRREFRDP